MSLTVQCRLLCKTLKSCWYFLHSILKYWVFWLKVELSSHLLGQRVFLFFFFSVATEGWSHSVPLLVKPKSDCKKRPVVSSCCELISFFFPLLLLFVVVLKTILDLPFLNLISQKTSAKTWTIYRDWQFNWLVFLFFFN